MHKVRHPRHVIRHALASRDPNGLTFVKFVHKRRRRRRRRRSQNHQRYRRQLHKHRRRRRQNITRTRPRKSQCPFCFVSCHSVGWVCEQVYDVMMSMMPW